MDKEKRYQSWNEIHENNPEIINKLPQPDRGYVLGKINEYRAIHYPPPPPPPEVQQAKAQEKFNQKIQASLADFLKNSAVFFKSNEEPWIPKEVFSLIVVVGSILIFGSSAYELAKATGKKEFALAGGVIVGALAGWVAEHHGQKVFTDLAMKGIYETRKAQLNAEEQE